MANKRDNKFYDFMFSDKRESSNSNSFQGFQRDNNVYNFMTEPKKEEQQRQEQPYYDFHNRGVGNPTGNSIWILESSYNNNTNNNSTRNINNNGARNVNYSFIPSKTIYGTKGGSKGRTGNSSWKQDSSQDKDNNNSKNASSVNKRN